MQSFLSLFQRFSQQLHFIASFSTQRLENTLKDRDGQIKALLTVFTVPEISREEEYGVPVRGELGVSVVQCFSKNHKIQIDWFWGIYCVMFWQCFG